MLKYIEKTTNNNVTNQDIESIQQLVERVKRKKEVGINYMKSWEIEKMVREEGYAEGYDGGYSKGYDSGQDRVNLLNARLSEAGRMADIVKAALDKEYQESLFEEFHL
ncbi:MAG: hypothetical protein HDR71_11820 [Lachnospiraceae bacterium]|nr:hypothetical protein [Lachnospiraceae bacterium]